MKTASCDFERLYSAGGIYEQLPSNGASIEVLGKWLGEVYPGYSYPRALPVHVLSTDASVEETLRQSYAAFNERFTLGPRTGIFELNDVVLYDRTLYAIVSPGELVSVFETDREVDRPWKSDLEPVLLKNARRATDPDMQYVYFSSVGSTNYGHWIVDDLTRAKAVLKGPWRDGKVAVLLDRYFTLMDDMRAQSLGALLTDGPRGEMVFIDKDVPYLFDRLYYVSPSSYPPVLKCPDGVRFLHDRLNLPAEESPKRIFLNRTASWRNLLNQKEVSEFLAAFSFVTVSLGFATMTFEEQRRLFANAEVVIGVSGAAMVNTLFCPPATKVIYLAGEGFVDPWYWDLAAIKGHEYSVCFGTPWKPEAPNFSSFRIEEKHLSTIVEWF